LINSFARRAKKSSTGSFPNSPTLGRPSAALRDLVAVMSAEGVNRAVVAGVSEGGIMAAFFAATFPERTEV